MKKLLFAILLIIIFLPTNSASAATTTATLLCPSTADVNSTVTCTLSGTSGDTDELDANGNSTGNIVPDPAEYAYGEIATG